MSPDSAGAQWLAVAGAVVAAIALGLLWPVGRGWYRVALRTLSIVVSLSLATTAGLIGANRLSDVYPTWSSLIGDTGALPAVAAGGAGTGGGRIVSFSVPGPHSGLTLPAYAYLPAGYDRHPALRYPVIEALDGFPGSPAGWFHSLGVTRVLDGEIAAGRMAPTVVLFPYQTPRTDLDTECANLIGGPQAETFLTVDVPAAAVARLHVRTDAVGWGLIGYSAGGYCASDLLLRHPGRYRAGASLSGYATPGIAIGDGSERTTYNDLWRLSHRPVPDVALYLACARDDVTSMRNTTALAGAARSPLTLTKAYINGGGHNGRSWRAMEPPAFDWLSSWLAAPTTGQQVVRPGAGSTVPARPVRRG